METLAPAPPRVLAANVGSLIAEPTAHSLDLYLREEPVHIGDYPQPCPVDIHLPSWHYPPTTVIAIVVRLARKDRLTFQTWINAAEMRGRAILSNLASDGRLFVHLVTTAVVRSLRVPNVVKRHAVRLVDELARRGSWDPAQFDEGRRRVDTLYPTPSKLFRACERNLA